MVEPYSGREQTAAKHVILRRYLQTLTFKLLQSGYDEIAYIDGFSGPWESRTADYSDTSFMIALEVLKDAQTKTQESGRRKIVKCFFVEADKAAYGELDKAVKPYRDPRAGFHIETYNGKFEDAVPQIIDFIGQSFALIFIDPTGWTGYPYSKIRPVLQHRPSEVLINFMFDHVNRFAASDDPAIVASLAPILGGLNWRNKLDPKLPRGLAIEKLFRDTLATEGEFEHVLSTRIDKRTSDRTHFIIAYGTRMPHGVRAFRDTEYTALKQHEKLRGQAKQKKLDERTGMKSLFEGDTLPDNSLLDALIHATRCNAAAWIEDELAVCRTVTFAQLCTAVLKTFMLRETDVKDICVSLARDGFISDTWSGDKKRKPHNHHLITTAFS